MKRLEMRGGDAVTCEGDQCALPRAEGEDHGDNEVRSTKPASVEENPQASR